jgi:hypothetical protein
MIDTEANIADARQGTMRNGLMGFGVSSPQAAASQAMRGKVQAKPG